MSDKSQMPRMKEQEKDNAFEVRKNIPEQNLRRREKIQEKTEEELEMEEVHACDPHGKCGCGCGGCGGE